MPPALSETPAHHPYAPQVKRRYLHQLAALRPTLAAWRRALSALLVAAEPPGAAEARRLARLRLAYDAVPFYQARFRALGWGRHQLAEPGRFEALPPLRRADLQAGGTSLLVHPAPPAALRADVYVGRTSGSTGEPVTFQMDAAAYHSFFPVVDLVLRWLNLRAPLPGEGFALLDVLGHSPEYGALLPLFHGARFQKLTVTRPGFEARLRALRPAVLVGDPDSLGALLCAPRRLTDALRPRLALSSAFALPPDVREALVRRLRCPVVDYYSAAELGPLALRCPAGRGFHVLTPYVHLESAPLPGDDGPGELLVTDLRNAVQPLLRYAVGDRGTIQSDISGCVCGLHTPLLTALAGRTAARFHRPDQTRWDPAAVAPSLGRLPVTAFRLIEEAPLRLRLEYEADAPLEARALEGLAARLRAVAGGPVALTAVHRRDPLRAPGVKPQPFVALPELAP